LLGQRRRRHPARRAAPGDDDPLHDLVLHDVPSGRVNGSDD
jgi:hypothetical protein